MVSHGAARSLQIARMKTEATVQTAQSAVALYESRALVTLQVIRVLNRLMEGLVKPTEVT